MLASVPAYLTETSDRPGNLSPETTLYPVRVFESRRLTLLGVPLDDPVPVELG